MNRKIWIAIGAVVFFVLATLFVRATLPGHPAEFVGNWKNSMHAKATLELRPDGTFSKRCFEDWPAFSKSQWYDVTGTWKATHDALYLWATSVTSVGKTLDEPSFETLKEKWLD